MNDQTQNELLSAYLDGELNAAEGADVERLLAADASARQLLDDLRALSVTLQSLPQEKVGEDLSECVLRTAARRVLLEKRAGRNCSPRAGRRALAESLFHRLFNTRGLVYAGIAVAFAVLIMFVERQQQESGPNTAKELALSQQSSEITAAEREGQPPTIQATRESVMAAAKPSTAPMAKSVPTATEPPAEKFALKSAPTAPPPGELQGVRRGYAFTRTLPKAGKAGLDAADKKASGAPAVLVVHCDASAEAIANHDFEKLLAANGIHRSRRLDLSDLDDKAKGGSGIAGDHGGVAPKQYKGAENALPPPPSDDLLIYVEAAPEQIEATLAALAGQPKAFSNVSVNPPQAVPPADLAFSRPEEQTQAGAVAGEESQEKSSAAGGKAAAKASPRGGEMFGSPGSANGPTEAEKTPAPAPAAANPTPNQAAVEDANKRDESSAKAKEPEKDRSQQSAQKDQDNRQSQPRSQSQPPGRPAARQRVLFVLRNIGGAQPPVAAARIQPADQTEASKPKAQQSAPPAKKPAKGK